MPTFSVQTASKLDTFRAIKSGFKTNKVGPELELKVGSKTMDELNQDNTSAPLKARDLNASSGAAAGARSEKASVKINSSKKKASKTAKKPASKPEEKAGALEASNTGVSFISAPFTVSQRRHHGTNSTGLMRLITPFEIFTDSRPCCRFKGPLRAKTGTLTPPKYRPFSGFSGPLAGFNLTKYAKIGRY